MVRDHWLSVLLVFALLSLGCASGGGERIRIDMRNVAGHGYMPGEVTTMLQALGYDWVPIPDPNSRREVQTVQQNDEYRMQFEYLETRQVRIDVRIRRKDGLTRLHFHEPGSNTLSASSRALLERLQQRVVQEFGAPNVRY
jgi:hypothetical protein